MSIIFVVVLAIVVPFSLANDESCADNASNITSPASGMTYDCKDIFLCNRRWFEGHCQKSCGLCGITLSGPWDTGVPSMFFITRLF